MEGLLQKHLEAQLKTGIMQGTYAACRVVYDKATDATKTPEENLESIIQFCKPIIDSVENNDKSEPEAKGQTGE